MIFLIRKVGYVNSLEGNWPLFSKWFPGGERISNDVLPQQKHMAFVWFLEKDSQMEKMYGNICGT